MFASQAVNLPEGKWNSVNEPSPGSLQAPAVQSRWLGMLGKAWYADNVSALKASNLTTGTLRSGWYALVQTVSGSTAAPAVGKACFFSTAANMGNFIVTPDGGATLDGRMAGVYISAPTKGNYCIIQLGGDCTILYKSSPTSTTDGALVSLVTTDNVFDALLDATSVIVAGGAASIKTIKGIALEAPATAALKRAYIYPNFWNFNLS